MRSRLQWVGHLERMADDRLPKRAAELREPSRRRRGRPRLRWEDCVKRDVKKTGEEGDWKKKTRDRGWWKRLADEAVKKLQAAPHPGLIKGKRGRERERADGRRRLVSHPKDKMGFATKNSSFETTAASVSLQLATLESDNLSTISGHLSKSIVFEPELQTDLME